MRLRLLCMAIGVAFVAGPAAAQSNVFVYPQQGQDKEQQQKDEYECFQWAKEQSGVDPMQGAPKGGTRTGRGTLGGAAKGAGVGAAIGAIAGGKKGAKKGAAIGGVGGGVMGRRGSKASQQDAKDTAVSSYNRAYAACLEARGYSVK